MLMSIRRFILLALLLLLVAGCGERAGTDAAGSGRTLETIRLPMGFVADPQYAPFYVAVERGYYAAEGFAIEFDYSFETDGVALVGANELPFAIVSGEQVLLARAQNVPVVYVMEWFEHYPIAIIARRSAGIERPADLVGRTVGIPGFFGATYVGYVGLLEANGLGEEQVNATEIGFTQVESLLQGQVDAVAGYINNEPVQLLARGEDITVLAVADYVDMVANGIITNEQLIEQDPDKVQRFVRATLRGLEDTLADPQAAFEISKKYVEGLDDSRYDVLLASLVLWEGDPLGATELAAWRQTQQVLFSAGFLDQRLPNLEAAFTNQFVISSLPQAR